MDIIKGNSLRRDIFRIIFFNSLIIVSLFGIIIGLMEYREITIKVDSYLTQKNLSYKYLIEGYFTKMHNYIRILASDSHVKNLFSNKDNKKYVLNLLLNFENSDRDINYIYIGHPDGSLVINNYEPPDGFNSTVRPWYKIALKNNPEISEGLPYQEIKTKEWLVSLSKVLIDDNNNVSGVIAIDTSLQRLINILYDKNDTPFKSQNTFIITNNGDIIIHEDTEMLRKNFHKICKTATKNSRSEYTFENSKKIYVVNDINTVHWRVITEIDKSELVFHILKRVALAIIIVISSTILVGLILSKILGERIIKPILNLKKRTKLILDRETIISDYLYPNNEIGQIAKDLENITSDAIYLKNKELQDLNDKLKALSETDQLTGLYNRRKIETHLHSEFTRYLRYKGIFSIILFDVDNFKSINDNYGHNTGDYVLKELSTLLKKHLRESDLPARWGGEEFLILCPETNGQNALIIAEKIRKIVSEYDFGIDRAVTISLGIAEINENTPNIDTLLLKADKNLYKAKNSGKNCTVFQ